MTNATPPSVFAGLVPDRARPIATDQAKSMNSTMPILLVGTMAVLNLAPPAATPAAATSLQPQARQETLRQETRGAVASVRSIAKSSVPAPSTYRVVAGDTVSSIAARFGLSAASVLALNGLSRSSLIFPNQVLRLAADSTEKTVSAPPAVKPLSYRVAAGDTVSAIAKRFGVSTDALLAANGLRASSIIRPGQVLTIPGGQSTPVLAIKTVSSVTRTETAPAPTPSGSSYVIRSGDTLSSIAAKFGVSVQALLDANNLTSSSTIYAGSTLRVPGGATGTGGPAPKGVTALNDEQAAQAFTIIAVGRELGVPDYGIVIALATAMQESSMRNLTYGHLDSVGLFQQRPSSGWGTVAQLTTPSHAARLFYGGPKNPNKGKTRGLLDIANWQSMTVTQAAQKVQVSAYPDAYAKWEDSARYWLSELG